MYQTHQRVKIQKMMKKYSKLAINSMLRRLYTIFCIKKKKFFLFFLKPVTKGTKVRSVMYQHLIAQICILGQGTIGYKRYKCIKK